MMRPGSMNGFNYTQGNPILFVDPSGEILDPSDPTQRGTIIHEMIQLQYLYTFGINGAVGIEVEVPLASKKGLRKFGDFWGTDVNTLASGRADIIDFNENGLYEIKPYYAAELGVVTVGWYISAWNTYRAQRGMGPYLAPGTRYPFPPGIVVGTDPANAAMWVMAELHFPRVILYRATPKSPTAPIPIFVFEYNPNIGKVERRTGRDAGQPFPAPVPTLLQQADKTVGTLAEIGVFYCVYQVLKTGFEAYRCVSTGVCVAY